MPSPPAGCSSSPRLEARVHWASKPRSARSPPASAPPSPSSTCASRISTRRSAIPCRWWCTRRARATYAMCSWMESPSCSASSSSPRRSKTSCGRPIAARPSCTTPPSWGERMLLFPAVALAFAIHTPPPPDSGAALFQAWCKSCHGADGRGTPAAGTRLDAPPADLRDCQASTAEPEERWVEIVSQGGAAFGLSLDMPAFGEAATPSQIRAVVRYARSLCGELGWPPGELNFPRAFLVEKAYPENEWVVSAAGREQDLIYERRVGKRLQVEGVARTVFDSVDRPFDGVTLAAKYNLWHSLPRRALASVGLEATPPLGRQERWEIEPFVAFVAAPPSDRLRVVGLRGRAAISWVVASRLLKSVSLGHELLTAAELHRVVRPSGAP